MLTNLLLLTMMFLVAEFALRWFSFPVFAEPNIVLRDDGGKRF
jgi:hypothetical protein